MPRELRKLSRALRLERATVGGRPGWQGLGVQGSRIVVGAVGVGTHASTRASARILDEVRPSRVLVVGVAGAVDSDLAIAELISPVAVVDASDGTLYTPHVSPHPVPEAATRTRTLATVHRFGDPVPAGASAVDMETAVIAAQCERRGIPWDVRRAISDLPGALRATVAALLGADGRADLVAVARLLARDPGQFGALLRLGRDSSRAVASFTASAARELRGWAVE